MSDDPRRHDAAGSADELLRRALIDTDAAATVALRVEHLPVSQTVTVIFHGRRDLGTLQTYIANGPRGAGSAVDADELLRIPCELDLAGTDGRADAERAFAEQAGALRDALVGADTVLEVWREPLTDLAGDAVAIDRSVELDVSLPAHRLMPTALVGARPPAHRRARLRSANPRRRAPAARDRVRAARRRPRLPAAGRPRPLSRGLPHARRIPRARARRAARPAGAIGPPLPRALGRRPARRRLSRARAPPRADRHHPRPCRVRCASP